jgi:N-acetylmuramoyl-L-alanine amidase
MNRIERSMDLRHVIGGSLVGLLGVMVQPAWANSSLFVAYPPDQHETTSDRIFFIGTGDPSSPVQINGQPIENRSPAGHFAPSLPLVMGENVFRLTQGDQTLTLTIHRLSSEPTIPSGIGFAPDSLWPNQALSRLPGELICFSAVGTPNAEVSVALNSQTIALLPQSNAVVLPNNAAVLTNQIAPTQATTTAYGGCTTFEQPGTVGIPEFRLRQNGQTVTQASTGAIDILSPTTFQIAEVTAPSGAARTGPSTDYSRLTPLPTGTRATITGREGEWFRLDYGAWIRERDITVSASSMPIGTVVRGVRSQLVPNWTEITFPLQAPVPVSITQGTDTFTLTLYNTTAQTDTIYLAGDPIIERLDWQPGLTYPGQPDTVSYTFHMKTDQQWGYKLRYEGTSLVLSLRHPPASRPDRPLQGVRILLDPGHGSSEDYGARGPNGYPEKDVTLLVSKLLRDELQRRGATVIMTREGDEDVLPNARAELIAQSEPNLALSIHYNALPDSGDAINTAGIGMFWYQTQAHDLAQFLHDYLVNELDRPSYGVFWNNLALTRPSVAPSVLLELGFMINPNEFEWIVDPASQQALAMTLADGISAWITQQE